MKENEKKILIADPSSYNSKNSDGFFTKYCKTDYDIFYSSSELETCKIASQILPDLIIFDTDIKSINTIRAIKLLKRVVKTKDIPILIISSETELDDIFTAGADDFLFKPFTEEEFRYRIKCVLNLGFNIHKIKQQNELLSRQAIEMHNQYKQMEMQRKDIIDDVTYSRRIQNAIMPTTEIMSSYLSEHFLFFRPKRIVSGDFYWIASKENKVILAVADCTGHGISGAFLTIAGTAFLNEIVNYTTIDAAEILNQLRIRIMRLLNQKGLEGETADGMDISLVIIDFNNLTLQFAAANNPAYLIRKDGSNIDLFSDRMPIGIHINFAKPFQNQNYIFEKGDVLYMFTDGYIDQFGGPNDQKFRIKRLKELLHEIYLLPMNEQLKIIESTIDKWMGYRDQVDDILMIGIRL